MLVSQAELETSVIGYRLTKYDPHQRDADGKFPGDDWTSVSDIGKTFNGVPLSRQSYLHVENACVQAVEALLAAAGVNAMRIVDIEVRTIAADALADINDDVIEVCENIQNEKIISGRDLQNVVRGCLRECMWCKLVGRDGAYVHFGYDYYVYVGLPTRVNLPALPAGIFLEVFDSPYLGDEEE